jgi:hypothetical protein
VPQDKTQAARLYQRAADQGHAQAQCTLGACYMNGEGVPEDKAQGARLYQRAADQGHADSQLYLGLCYDQGDGMPQDKAQAARLCRLAADQGLARTWARPWLSIGWRSRGDTQTRMRILGCALRRGGACRSTAPRPSACTSSRRTVARSLRTRTQANSWLLWMTPSAPRRTAWRPQSRSRASAMQCTASTSQRAVGIALQPSVSGRSRGGAMQHRRAVLAVAPRASSRRAPSAASRASATWSVPCGCGPHTRRVQGMAQGLSRAGPGLSQRWLWQAQRQAGGRDYNLHAVHCERHARRTLAA